MVFHRLYYKLFSSYNIILFKSLLVFLMFIYMTSPAGLIERNWINKSPGTVLLYCLCWTLRSGARTCPRGIIRQKEEIYPWDVCRFHHPRILSCLFFLSSKPLNIHKQNIEIHGLWVSLIVPIPLLSEVCNVNDCHKIRTLAFWLAFAWGGALTCCCSARACWRCLPGVVFLCQYWKKNKRGGREKPVLHLQI